MLNKDKILGSASRIAHRLMRDHKLYASYTTDMGLIGLLNLYDATQKQEYLNFVLRVLDFREKNNSGMHDWNILFVCLHYEIWLRTRDENYIKDFVSVTENMISTLKKDEGGVITFHKHPEKKLIFIDMLQGYASYMARAGFISGKEEYFKECIEQYKLYRKILRDDKTGLWHQGRNWSNKANFISPGFWNRGQGWIIAGMVNCLECFPIGSEYADSMKKMLNEFTKSLFKYQDKRGMWHQCTDRMDSYPETSGSAMFIHYLYKAAKEGWIDSIKYLPLLEKGVTALQGFVTKEGTVLNSSYGCGPLQSEEGYLYRPSPPREPHSAGTMLMALSAPFIEE